MCTVHVSPFGGIQPRSIYSVLLYKVAKRSRLYAPSECQIQHAFPCRFPLVPQALRPAWHTRAGSRYQCCKESPVRRWCIWPQSQ